jgi:hypothetical protein
VPASNGSELAWLELGCAAWIASDLVLYRIRPVDHALAAGLGLSFKIHRAKAIARRLAKNSMSKANKL